MVQFLSINFFSWISSIFVGFFKSSLFFFVSPVQELRMDTEAFRKGCYEGVGMK